MNISFVQFCERCNISFLWLSWQHIYRRKSKLFIFSEYIYPPAIITWKRGHGSVPSTFSNEDGKLTITNMQVKDEGFYICSAENYLGIVIIYLLYYFSKRRGNLIKGIPAKKIKITLDDENWQKAIICYEFVQVIFMY